VNIPTGMQLFRTGVQFSSFAVNKPLAGLLAVVIEQQQQLPFYSHYSGQLC